MFCKECGNKISDNADVCIKCGVSTHKGSKNPDAKSRVAYILFSVLLGLFGFPGIHNLYAGYTSQGLIQLLVTVCSCWILWLPMYVWSIVEVCTINQDADGIEFV